MSDDKSKRGPTDRRRIAYEQRHERVYWCQRFRCTELELLLAIQACLSHRVVDVRETIQHARAYVRRTNRRRPAKKTVARRRRG